MKNNNCAFQYAKMSGEIFRTIEIVCDKTELTLNEAKQLWNDYYSNCAKHIKDGGTVEMVIWINMIDSHSYNETLQYISTNAESDGISIWETVKNYYTKEFNIETSEILKTA